MRLRSGQDGGKGMQPPIPIIEDMWTRLNLAILFLTLTHLSVVLFAGSLLFGRAVIPSLLFTKDAPPKARMGIPLFLVLGALGIIGVFVFGYLFFDYSGVELEIYDRVWY